MKAQRVLSPVITHTRVWGMFYGYMAFKHKIRMLLLSFTLLLAFYDLTRADVIEMVILSVWLLIKWDINHLDWPFLFPVKCLISKLHPITQSLEANWLKPMPCQLLLLDNILLDPICRAFLIALLTLLSQSIFTLSVWVMETYWVSWLASLCFSVTTASMA